MTKGSPNYGQVQWDDVSFHQSIENVLKKVAKLNMLEYWPDLKKILEVNKEIVEWGRRIDARMSV